MWSPQSQPCRTKDNAAVGVLQYVSHTNNMYFRYSGSSASDMCNDSWKELLFLLQLRIIPLILNYIKHWANKSTHVAKRRLSIVARAPRFEGSLKIYTYVQLSKRCQKIPSFIYIKCIVKNMHGSSLPEEHLHTLDKRKHKVYKACP